MSEVSASRGQPQWPSSTNLSAILAQARPGPSDNNVNYPNEIGPGPQRRLSQVFARHPFLGTAEIWTGSVNNRISAYVVTDTAWLALGSVPTRDLPATRLWVERHGDKRADGTAPGLYQQAQKALAHPELNGRRHPDGYVNVKADWTRDQPALAQNNPRLGSIPTFDTRLHTVMASAGIVP